jgi:hypothetical protein
MFNISKMIKIWAENASLLRSAIPSVGEIFYVNGNTGSDANSGTKSSAPFLTIAEALDNVTADADDYIIVLDHWAETFPIDVDVQRTHIIGLDMGTGWPQLQSATDTAIFNVTKDYCEIAGFALQAPAQTTAHALIEFMTAAVGRANIHHNFLGELNVAYHAIKNTVAGAGANNWIHENVFGWQLAGSGITGSGALGRFNHNTFHSGIAGICITLNGVISEIIGNKFAMVDSAGYAITLNGQGGGIIDDNHAMELATDPTSNPYRDLGTPKANWGLNYKGVTALLPATT